MDKEQIKIPVEGINAGSIYYRTVMMRHSSENYSNVSGIMEKGEFITKAMIDACR